MSVYLFEFTAFESTFEMEFVFFRCSGIEDSLANCPFNGWERHDCSQGEEASVICGPRPLQGETFSLCFAAFERTVFVWLLMFLFSAPYVYAVFLMSLNMNNNNFIGPRSQAPSRHTFPLSPWFWDGFYSLLLKTSDNYIRRFQIPSSWWQQFLYTMFIKSKFS